MIKLSDKEIYEKLKNHELYLESDGKKGYVADFNGCDLRNINLSGFNLQYAIFMYSDLKGANFSNSDLTYANFSSSYLVKSNFEKSDLRNSSFSNSDLSFSKLNSCNLNNSNLSNSILLNSNLSFSKLIGSNFQNSDLINADLTCIEYDYTTIGINLSCPEYGEYIAYKKARSNLYEDVIVKLLVLSDSLRSSATSRKCRCSKAKVLDISSINGKKNYFEASSSFDKNFKYVVGEIIEVESFDIDRWNECSTGIHHFLTRKEAVEYIM